MAGISPGDLIATQTFIVETLRADMAGLENRLNARLDERIEARDTVHAERAEHVDLELVEHREAIAKIELRLARRPLLKLSKTQWSAVFTGAGVVYEGVRQAVIFLVHLGAQGAVKP